MEYSDNDSFSDVNQTDGGDRWRSERERSNEEHDNMIRLNRTLMLEEHIEHALAQERDFQAAVELETAENDELQYTVALLE